MEHKNFDFKIIERNFADLGGNINIDALAKCEEVFVRVVDDRISKLTVAVRTNDVKSIEMTAHQLKGSFLVLGGDALAQDCLTLERGAESLSPAAMEEILRNIKENLPSFRTDLAKTVHSLKAAARPSAVGAD